MTAPAIQWVPGEGPDHWLLLRNGRQVGDIMRVQRGWLALADATGRRSVTPSIADAAEHLVAVTGGTP